MTAGVQLPLFPGRFHRNGKRQDEAKLVRRLREATEPRVHGLTRRQLKRLMTALPRITVHD